MEDRGLESVDASTLPINDLGQSGKSSAAECAANPTISCEIDADLQAVIDAWPELSPESRVEVLVIVEAAREQDR